MTLHTYPMAACEATGGRGRGSRGRAEGLDERGEDLLQLRREAVGRVGEVAFGDALEEAAGGAEGIGLGDELSEGVGGIAFTRSQGMVRRVPDPLRPPDTRQRRR